MSQSLIQLMDEHRELKRKVKEIGGKICHEVEFLDHLKPLSSIEILDWILGNYLSAVNCAEDLKKLIDSLIESHGLDRETIYDEIHQIWIRNYS